MGFTSCATAACEIQAACEKNHTRSSSPFGTSHVCPRDRLFRLLLRVSREGIWQAFQTSYLSFWRLAVAGKMHPPHRQAIWSVQCWSPLKSQWEDQGGHRVWSQIIPTDACQVGFWEELSCIELPNFCVLPLPKTSCFRHHFESQMSHFFCYPGAYRITEFKPSSPQLISEAGSSHDCIHEDRGWTRVHLRSISQRSRLFESCARYVGYLV